MTNAVGAHVTRFPASDPSKAEKFDAGWSGGGLGIDSRGKVWSRVGGSSRDCQQETWRANRTRRVPALGPVADIARSDALRCSNPMLCG